MSAPELATYADGEGDVSGDNLNTFAQTANTYDDLRAFVGTTGQMVYARGRDAVTDGYGGFFQWNGSSTGTDDDFSIITPTGQTEGRWIRNTPPLAGMFGVLTGSATVDFPSCADGDMEPGDVNITVTGAAVGDFVQIVASIALTAKTFLFGTVSTTNTVIPYIGNMSGSPVNMVSCTVYAFVQKRSSVFSA